MQLRVPLGTWNPSNQVPTEGGVPQVSCTLRSIPGSHGQAKDCLGSSNPSFDAFPVPLCMVTYNVLEEMDYWVFILGPAVLRLLGQGAIVGSSCV